MRRCETATGCHRDDRRSPWPGRPPRAGERRLGVRRRRQDADLLGQQPVALAGRGQDQPGPGAEEVRGADRDQGQPPGDRLARPLQQDPRRDHQRPGPRRPQHRQHLGALAAGDRRVHAVRPTRSSTPSAARSKFVEAAVKTGGAEGKDPTSVPYLGLVYGLYYNKKMFADAGLQPADDLGGAGLRRAEADRPRARASTGWPWRAAATPRACTSRSSSASSTAPTRSPPTASRLHQRRHGRRREAVRRPDGRGQGGQPQQPRSTRTAPRRPVTSPRARPRC